MKKTKLLGAKVFVEDIGSFKDTYTGEARLVGYGTRRAGCFIVEIPEDFGWNLSVYEETDIYMNGYHEVPQGHSLLYCGIDGIQIIFEEDKIIGGIETIKNKDFIIRGLNKNNINAVSDKITEMGYTHTMNHEELRLDTIALIEAYKDWTADLATGSLLYGAIKFAEYVMDGFDGKDLYEIRDNVIILTADEFLAL